MVVWKVRALEESTILSSLNLRPTITNVGLQSLASCWDNDCVCLCIDGEIMFLNSTHFEWVVLLFMFRFLCFMVDMAMDSSYKRSLNMGRTMLNPDAAEFVPRGLQSSSSPSVTSRALDASLSNNDSNTDRSKIEVQLPDDLTADFGFLSETSDNSCDTQQWANMGIDPIERLVNDFPSFGAKSLMDIYLANNGDLNLTIEILTQLELQEDTKLSCPCTSSSPSINLMEFPSLSGSQIGSPLLDRDGKGVSVRTNSGIKVEDLFSVRSYSTRDLQSAMDFATVVRKNSDAAIVKPDQSRHEHPGFGTLRTSSQSFEVGRLDGRDFQKVTPVWVETGEAVSNVYANLREEARDNARVRNAYFEQARRAYLIGNKALAKDLSAKGQLYNEKMKEAHKRASEAIFIQRNLSTGAVLQGEPELLDLHGLHVNEAIPLLKRKLATVRMTARATQQRQQIFVCVGTGHHTKGAQTPARLPIAVEKFLAEDEHLHFTEQQPGMLKVVVG